MNDEIKEIKTIGQLLDYVETEAKAKELIDYITNLQQENERLKQPQVFIDTQDMEERYGEELYKDYLKEQLENYKSRIDKTIEHIEKHQFIFQSQYKDESNFDNHLLDILKGDSNE